MTISIAQAQLFFLAVVRILAILIHIPVLGGQNIPNQVRIALGLVLAVVLIPWQPLPADTAPTGIWFFGVAIAREIVIGTLAGYAADLAFGAVQIAGEAMGLGSGFASSHIFNPALGNTGSSFNQFFLILAMMVFLLINGHHLALIALQRTFEAVPLNTSLPFGSLESMIKITAQLITAGVHLALPVMAALILTDIGLGLLARVAPQVQIFFLGLPLKVGVSLVAMGMLFTVVLPYLGNLYRSVGENMLLLLEK